MKLALLDSISVITAVQGGAFVVTGSHGGVSAAQFVLVARDLPSAVAFNDAGIGKDDAGVAALSMLQERGVIAVAYSHLSACIGDAKDAWDHGMVTRVNEAAAQLGIKNGMSVRESFDLWITRLS